MKTPTPKASRSLLLAAFVGSALVLSGCASNLSGSSYSRADARAVQSVRMGTIESLRAVQIEGTRTPIGTLAGAAVGGIAGSGIGVAVAPQSPPSSVASPVGPPARRWKRA